MGYDKLKVVPKIDNSRGVIVVVAPNGDNKVIVEVMFPNDRQMADNVDCMNEIASAIKKRIRKSV